MKQVPAAHWDSPTDAPKPCSSRCREDVDSTVPSHCPIHEHTLPKSPPNSAREGGECPSGMQEPQLSLDLAFDR